MLDPIQMTMTKMPQPWEREQMLESRLLHPNRTRSHTLRHPTDPLSPVPTSLRMPARARDHHTHPETYHDNAPPTTHKQTTMQRSELLLQHCYRLGQLPRGVCRNEISNLLQWAMSRWV
jgi:hypothetical protein